MLSLLQCWHSSVGVPMHVPATAMAAEARKAHSEGRRGCLGAGAAFSSADQSAGLQEAE